MVELVIVKRLNDHQFWTEVGLLNSPTVQFFSTVGETHFPSLCYDSVRNPWRNFHRYLCFELVIPVIRDRLSRGSCQLTKISGTGGIRLPYFVKKQKNWQITDQPWPRIARRENDFFLWSEKDWSDMVEVTTTMILAARRWSHMSKELSKFQKAREPEEINPYSEPISSRWETANDSGWRSKGQRQISRQEFMMNQVCQSRPTSSKSGRMQEARVFASDVQSREIIRFISISLFEPRWAMVAVSVNGLSCGLWISLLNPSGRPSLSRPRCRWTWTSASTEDARIQLRRNRLFV